MSLLTRGPAKTPTGAPEPSYETAYDPIARFRLSKKSKPKTCWRDTFETFLSIIAAVGWGLLIVSLFSISVYADIPALLFMMSNILLLVVSVAKQPLGDTWLIGSPIELLFV